MTLNRRQLLYRCSQNFCAAGMLGVFAASSPAAVDDSAAALPIIDTHQHLWDLEQMQPPWLQSAPDILRKSYVTKDYLAAIEGLNVVKAIYMEVDVHPRQHVQEAEHIIQLCKSSAHPTVAAVISGRPNSTRFPAYIRRFKDSPYVKGVRQVLHVPGAKPGLCLEKQFVQSVRLLGELGMSFDLCMRPKELQHGVQLADLCRDTRLIVDHCGNADPTAFLPQGQQGAEPWHNRQQWQRDMDQLAQRTHVVCKISGIVARAPQGWQVEHLAPIINHCLEAFGPDRVVFGGDWPVCLLGASFRQWVEALKTVIQDRPLQLQRKLLHDNAHRLYGLAGR